MIKLRSNRFYLDDKMIRIYSEVDVIICSFVM